MKTKQKFCPFLGSNCITTRCAIYNSQLHNCNINLLPYNFYKLSVSIDALVEAIDAEGTDSPDNSGGLAALLFNNRSEAN